MRSQPLIFDASSLQSSLPRSPHLLPQPHACLSQKLLNYSNPNRARCKARKAAAAGSGGPVAAGTGDYVLKNSARSEARARALPSCLAKGAGFPARNTKKLPRKDVGPSSPSPNRKGAHPRRGNKGVGVPG